MKISFKNENNIKIFWGRQKRRVYFQETRITRDVKRSSSTGRKMIPDINLIPYKWMKNAGSGKYGGKYEIFSSFKKILFINLESTRVRSRGSSRLLSQQGPQCGARSWDSRIITWAEDKMLNQLSLPGASDFFFFIFITFLKITF